MVLNVTWDKDFWAQAGGGGSGSGTTLGREGQSEQGDRTLVGS